MGIEAVKSAAATYQGSVSVAEVKGENRPKIEQTKETKTAAEPTAKTIGDGSEGIQNSQIKKAVEDINKKANNSEAIFGIHEATNRVMIKIVDKETKEVIKELPPEKTLDMIAKVWELAGILVDEKR
jgi:flagellar protein FlaG